MTEFILRRVSICLSLCLCFGAASANEKVRVAFREYPGYSFEDKSGSRSGYAVEWLKRLALRLEWDIEWVDIQAGEAGRALADGRIDVSPFVLDSEYDPATVVFTHMPIGCCRMSLLVPQDSIFTADDFSELDGVIVGMLSHNPMREKLVAKLAESGVKCVCREFATQSELNEALKAGKIGAALGEMVDSLPNVRPLFRLSPLPFYVAVSRSRAELVGQIDEAVAEIADSEPEFITSLRVRYFRNESDRIISFTTMERRWIERQLRQNRAFTIDVSPVDGFVKSYDDEASTIGGLVGRIFAEVSVQTGLRFRSLRPRTEAEIAADFAAGRIDIQVPYGGLSSSVNEDDDATRNITMRIPQAIVTRRFSGVDIDDGRTTIAVVESDAARIAAYERLGAMDRVVVFPTAAAAVQAVLEAKVDSFPGDYPLVNRLVRGLSDPLLVDVAICTNPRYSSEMIIRVGPKTDRELVSVLAKCLAIFNRDRLVGFENDAEARDMGEGRIEIRTLKRFAIGALLVVLLIIIAILLYFGLKTRRLLHKSEASLMIAQDAIDDAAMARTRMREALEEAEYAARSKSNFLATMSHEIRTPLNAVIGFSEFLADPQVPRERIIEYSNGITLSANALLSLINDVLDFAKSESGEVGGLDVRIGQCDLEKLFAEMDSIFRMRAESKGLALSMKVASVVPLLELSESRMRQILMNLIGNAVKFTDHGGISVSASYVRGTLTLKISDTGIGITPHGMEHIFDPFSQDMDSRGGKVYAGTGLGLPIVKRIVEASKGKIMVRSIIGKGSTFTVELPEVRPLSSASVTDNQGQKTTESGPQHVIIVDDVAMNRKVLLLHCRALGLTDIKVFESAVEVLEYLKDSQHPCDLVLSDVWMPGMDGSELARQCAILRPGLPVVAVTADTDAGATFDISLFKGVLTKPISSEKLAALLATIHVPAVMTPPPADC